MVTEIQVRFSRSMVRCVAEALSVGACGLPRISAFLGMVFFEASSLFKMVIPAQSKDPA